MTDYYMQIQVTGSTELARDAFSQVINVLHGIYKDEGSSPLGVSFPYWQDHTDERKTTLGNVMRLFGDKFHLISFSRNADINTLEESGLVKIRQVKATPEDAVNTVVKRDRCIERYKKNGWPIKKMLLYIKYRSRRTKRTFSLFVDTKPAPEEKAGGFSTYGFRKDGSTVPYF